MANMDAASRDAKAQQPGKGFLPSLKALKQRLREAAGQAEPRQRALLDLEALGRFLEAIGGEEATAASLRLMGLMQAIAGLDEGHVLPLVTPVKPSHRPRMGPRDQMIAAAAAISMEAAILHGQPRQSAAQRVARLLDKARIGIGPKLDRFATAETVANWRDRLNAGPSDMDDWTIAEARWRMFMDSVKAGREVRRDVPEAMIGDLPAHLGALGF